MAKVDQFRLRRYKRLLNRLDAQDDKGHWITTKNRHKVHLNENGEPDKGNSHVIAAMTGGSSSSGGASSADKSTAKKAHRTQPSPTSKTVKVSGFKSKLSDYEKVLAKNEEFAKKNPYNLTYGETVEQYKGLTDAAKNLDVNNLPKSSSGYDAIAVMDGLPSGSTVRLKGTAYNDGEYTLTYWSKPGWTPGYIWQKTDGGKSFGSNPSTIISAFGGKNKLDKVNVEIVS